MNSSVSLVTGAAGFLGSHVVEALVERGHRVRALDLPGAPWGANLGPLLDGGKVKADRRDLLDITAADPIFAGVSGIVHCAGLADYAPSMADPEPYTRVNVGGMVRVLEAARHHGISRVVNASSAAVYGAAASPVHEGQLLAPTNPYALSKVMAEEACSAWTRFYGLSTASLRIFICYGPRAANGGIVVALMNRKRAGQPFGLTGDGGQLRDFVYAADVAEALVMGLDRPDLTGAFNVGGAPRSIRDLAELMNGTIEFLPARPGDADSFADATRIRRELGWEPKVSLEEGVRRLLAAD